MGLRRYKVMRKDANGQIEDMVFDSGLYFTKRGAFNRMHLFNVWGQYLDLPSIAIVWDLKLNRQISTSLYKEN